jgi:uncharacterized protein YgbK (DUF1537 family)
MTGKQIKTIACALFHDGIDVEKLSETARAELRRAVEILLKQSPQATEDTP